MARRYDIWSKIYKKPCQSASVIAQDGSAASSSDVSAPVIAPLDGGIARERATAACKKKVHQEECRTRSNMQATLKQTAHLRRDPGDKDLCPLDRRPTNDGAVTAEFLDAKGWYLQSSKEQGIDPVIAEMNYNSLPFAEPEEVSLDDGHAEVWAHRRGETQGGGARMNSVLYCARELAIADNGRGIADDPVYSKPAAPADNTAGKIVELGIQIRERTRLLKSEGLTGRQINDDAAIGRFVEELKTMKAALPNESTDGGTALFDNAVPNDQLRAGDDWLCYDEPDAHTLQLQLALGLEHPYSLSDVESAAIERIATAREELHETLTQRWVDSASHQTYEPLELPLPSGAITIDQVHEALLEAQLLRNPEKALIEALRDNEDPYRKRKRQVEFEEGQYAQAPGLKAKTDALNLDFFRLNPLTGVLE